MPVIPNRERTEALLPAAVLSIYPPHAGTVSSLFESRVKIREEKPFVVFRDREYSYREIQVKVHRAAALYSARAIGPGDRVGVMSKNHLSTIVTFLALARLGATMCPFNPGFRESEATYVIGHAQLKGILCAPDCLPVVRAALGATQAQPASRPWILLNERGNGIAAELPDWDAEMAGAPAAVPYDAATPDSTCVIIYTSGTTGLPKGVMHGQRAVSLTAEGFVGRLHLQQEDRQLCILPLFHVNALFYSVCGSLAAGAAVILLDTFSASTFWRSVKDSRASAVNFVAAIPGILGKRPREEFVPDHQLTRICVVPLTLETERLFTDEFGVSDLLDGYGMSEIPGVCITPLHGERRRGSAGKLCRHPNPSLLFAEMRVLDADDNDVAVGQTGEFAVRTPTLMQGYFRDPEQTRAAFREDGWFMTGDLGYRDADDFVWFVARKKDIIRKRGENIAGAELDRVIGLHPAVQEAAAIAVPDELGEDEILVVVVPRAGMTITAQAVADWCAERLARIKIPRYVVLADDLPRTATHRVEKHKLKADKALIARAVDLAPPHSPSNPLPIASAK